MTSEEKIKVSKKTNEERIKSLETSRGKIGDRLCELNDYQSFVEKRVISLSKDSMKQESYIKELERKTFELEHKIGVLWRWCLVNSILIIVFTLIFALR